MIVTPTTEVLVALTGPSDSIVEADREFDINITIQHASNRSYDAYDLLVFLDYCAQFVSAPNSFTVLFGHGYEREVGENKKYLCDPIGIDPKPAYIDFMFTPNLAT